MTPGAQAIKEEAEGGKDRKELLFKVQKSQE